MPEGKISDEIVVLLRDDNEYFEHEVLSLDYLRNTVPSVGDRLSLHIGDDSGVAVYHVDDRYLADTTALEGGRVNERFWVLIVKQIHAEHMFDLDIVVRGVQRYGFHNTWRGELHSFQVPEVSKLKAETADDLDRDNRDPAYWTPERKEILRREREARLAAMKASGPRKD